MAVTVRPAAWPFAMATINSKQVPCLVRHWEKGHAPSPQEWHAWIIYAAANGPAERLVSAKMIQRVGA